MKLKVCTTTSTNTPQPILSRTSTSNPLLPPSTSDHRRPPPATSATDLHQRPLPTSPPTTTDLRHRFHPEVVNAAIYGVVGATLVLERIAIFEIHNESVKQSHDERNVKLAVQCWPIM